MDRKRDSKGKCSPTPCTYGEDCYRQNPNHFQEYSHSHLEDLISKMKDGTMLLPAGYKHKISRRILEIQIGFQRNMKKYGTPGGKENDKTNDRNSNIVSPKISISNMASSSKTSLLSTSANITTLNSLAQSSAMNTRMEAEKYRTVVMDRVNDNIAEKWKESAPYYFFLSAVTDSKPTHSERLTVHFPELLDPRLGNLKESLQINFMVELGWLLAQYYCMGHSGKPITILYGEGDENMDRCPKYVTPVKIKCPSPFGTHHTKMSIMLYSDDSLRVIVSTGNLVESDWDNRVQGVWISPRCPSLPKDVDTGSGDSPTNFKRDLLHYLSSYMKPELQEWVGRVRRADFSEIRVFFVASVPGSHKESEFNNWAQGKLMSLLKNHVKLKQQEKEKSHLVAQCSSIGSLGPEPKSWLTGQIQSVFGKTTGFELSSTDISLMYPSFENVANSHDGLLGGGCLPYSKKSHEKQLWLHNYLYQWKSDKRHRTKAMPHIKTYSRITPDWKRVLWFLLTSANLSKAAWGNSRSPNSNYVMSYEAGVLFLPKFLVNEDELPIDKSAATNDVPVFPLPYDVPITPYNSSDVPWFFENLQ